MRKIPCQCPACQLLACLAFSLAADGYVSDAEEIARQITWLDEPVDSTEGYADMWQRPTTPSVDSENLN